MRVSDERRYLVEVMVGAMLADGSVDATELTRLRAILSEHELFSALSDRAAEQLIEIGFDAIQFAGGAARRLDVVAQNLPSRSLRLAAYAMACEVVAADARVERSEERFLAALRATLMISDDEGVTLEHAARRGRGLSALETMSAGLARLVPSIVRMQVLRRLSVRMLRDTDAVQIEALVAALPDTARYASLVDGELEMAEASMRAHATVGSALADLAEQVMGSTDRYWLTTFALAGDALRGSTGWHETEFFCALRVAFSLSPLTMRRAEAHARLLLRAGR